MEKEQFSNRSVGGQTRHKYYREHILQYGLLVLAFVFFSLVLFQLTSFLAKLVVICFLSAFYLLWGIWHHYEEKNLTLAHVLEYLAISVLIFAVLTFVFLSGRVG